ncbi:30S ribosomal protein S1 [Durusdinium trenchii]|uniref:30S ribosomal protein S1 n=1 Tax=Durusdinium trenchii TaxID=1381693 RepID=A0ABP0M676_9DINO
MGGSPLPPQSSDRKARALVRSALDFHAPVARSLGYDLPVDPNAAAVRGTPSRVATAYSEHQITSRCPPLNQGGEGRFASKSRLPSLGLRLQGALAFVLAQNVKSRMKSPQSLMKKFRKNRVAAPKGHLTWASLGEATAFAAASAILKYVSSVEAGWKIAPNSFKDYVSKPKKSGYQVTDFQANTLSVRRWAQQRRPSSVDALLIPLCKKIIEQGPSIPSALSTRAAHLHHSDEAPGAGSGENRERQGPASHATYKSFPLCPEDLMEKLGNEGVVSISEVELAQRAGYQDMDIEDLRLSRAHVNKVVSAFQELMAAETTSTLPLGDETDAASLPDGRRTSLIRRARGGEGDALAVGDTVSALCPDDSQWYPGAIEKINDDGTFSVKWDDPDGGPETHDIEVADIQKIVIFKDYKVGERVEAIFPDDGYWYPAEVTKVGDGRFTVKWDDPDGGPEESEVDAKEMKYPPIPYGDIEIGKKYDGTVRSVLDFGAFVDIGAESEGLLHISRISGERVENIYDVLSEGQKVEVWVSGKREDEEKFGLTMVEGKMDSAPRAPADLTPFADLPSDEWYNGKVARTAPFGAFVTVTLDSGAQADGLVHVSKIKDGFVDNVDDEVSIGQDVKVRIEDVDLDSNRMRLSMREGGFGGGPRAPVDLTPFESISPDNWLKGKVARLAPFGAFVTVTTPDGDATADGLVHITQIRDGFVESVEDELQVGQEVEVRVESANNEDGKMSLSMKQPF